ncbi:MAG TPA: hypothetical protein VFZ53_33550 [Polyangiaceae bacterium]
MVPDAHESPREAPRGARAAWVMLIVAALAAALVFWTRLTSWASCWRWTITEGREGPSIYAIWRVVHGAPLYEWPDREPYSVTFMNYGFFGAYAGVARVFGAGGEALLWVGRLFTLLGAVVGATLFVLAAKRLARPRGSLEWGALGALAFVVWFGTQFIAWWSLSIRPDLWAAAFALGGLYVALPGIAGAAPGRLAVASLLFFFAWSFKQSCILGFLGCAASTLVVARSIRALLALLVPFGTLVAASLAVGGEVYRYNIITVPAISDWHFGLMTEVLSRALPQNPWIFGFFPLALLAFWSEAGRKTWSALPAEVKTLAIVVVTSVALGTFALGREGSNKNHLFEGYISSSLASFWALHRLAWLETRPRILAIGLVGLVPLAAFPVAQLVLPNRLGRIVLCSQHDTAELEKLASAIRGLPKPLYTEEDIFSLPWNSNDNRYPTLVVDPTWYGIAKREGHVAPDFPRKLLAPPRFRTVVQFKGHPELDALYERGSACRPLPARWFGLELVACTTSPAAR